MYLHINYGHGTALRAFNSLSMHMEMYRNSIRLFCLQGGQHRTWEIVPFRKDWMDNISVIDLNKLRDRPKWARRVYKNLLYYQTNYASLMAFFLVAPYYAQNYTGLIRSVSFVCTIALAFYLHIASNIDFIRFLKSEYANLYSPCLLVMACLALRLCYSAPVALLGLLLGMLVVSGHASLSNRCTANKLHYVREKLYAKSVMWAVLHYSNIERLLCG